MKFLMNFPVYEGCLEACGGVEGVVRDCEELGLDGVEVVWGYEEESDDSKHGMPLPADLIVGYHLLFFPCWVDFWEGNEAALLEEYGDWDTVRSIYHAFTRDELVKRFRIDLRRAVDVGAEYVVFHVAEVNLVEGFTYDFAHSDREVCDCACELANMMLDGLDADIPFLVENQWWPGFKFTDPAMTRRLLDGIEYEHTGILLDTGHLMSTNLGLRTQAQAARYIRDCYDAHGDLREKVRALHLHKSLSGAYVAGAGYRVPDGYGGTYQERFAQSYPHILQVDRHEPWDDPIVADLVNHIRPTWVNNELSGYPREVHNDRVRTQMQALRTGLRR